MKRWFLILQSLFFLLQQSRSQTSSPDPLLDDISYHLDIMINAVEDRHRIRAYDIFSSSIDSLLLRPGSFDVALDSIRGLAVVHGDGFRIVTWQLRLSDSEYKYGGFMQWPDRIIRLIDNRPWLNGAAFSTFTPGAWYGCIYYNILPFENGKEKYYVLFGFNAENELVNTKLADILDLSGPEPKFGAPFFVGKEEGLKRLMLTYGDVSTVQLIYDPELKAIVHDHLESLPGIGPTGEALIVSDGSMEGWFLKNGKWVYKEEVYDVKMKEPPMLDERKNRKEDKDIFGRPKGN